MKVGMLKGINDTMKEGKSGLTFRVGGVFALMLITALTVTVKAQIVQWRGPQRDGKYPDTGLLKEWPSGGPSLILKKEGLGKGNSTPVMYKGMIYISGKRDSLDVVTKLDLQGNIIWETVYGLSWNQSFPESRSTPTIENDRIYLLGGQGTVACIDTNSGEIIWKVNTHKIYKGEYHRWGMAESLLLTPDAVISSPVGERTALVALDKKDGSLVWKTESLGGVRSYASPLLVDHNGREMILAVSSKDFFAVDPGKGDLIWSIDIAKLTADGDRVNTNTPLYHDGSVFISSGYDDISLMFTLSPTGDKADLIWSDTTLDDHHGGIVVVDGYIYGSNWLNNGDGNWVCQEWKTGKVMYEEHWNNKGSIIYADGRLYIYEEKRGNVGLLEPTPEKFNLISSFRVKEGTGPHWAHMSIYDKKLLIRHGDVLLVYDISEG